MSTKPQAKITVLPNGFISVQTTLSPEDISYLPGHTYNLLQNLFNEELTEDGKEAAYAILNVMKCLLPDEHQMLKGLHPNPYKKRKCT